MSASTTSTDVDIRVGLVRGSRWSCGPCDLHGIDAGTRVAAVRALAAHEATALHLQRVIEDRWVDWWRWRVSNRRPCDPSIQARLLVAPRRAFDAGRAAA